jgi:hypothetical protein
MRSRARKRGDRGSRCPFLRTLFPPRDGAPPFNVWLRRARRRTRIVTAVLVDAALTSSSSSTPLGLEEEDRGEAKVYAAAVSPEAEADEDTVHIDKTVD